MSDVVERKEERVNWSDFKTVEACEQGAWCELDLPNGDASPMRIKLIGKDSKKYRNRLKKLFDRSRKKKNGFSADEAEAETMDVYVACTIAWEGFYEEVGGSTLEPTYENIRLVYESCPWIIDQVSDFIEDRSNFLSR